MGAFAATKSKVALVALFKLLKSHVVRLLLATAAVLLVPLVAMQFSDEVDWDLRDYIAIGVLLIGTGLGYEFVSTKLKSKYRQAAAAAVIAIMLLIWVELAVGIFGTPFAGS